MTAHLQRALEDLWGLERRTRKLDLAGTRALLGALGDPQRRFRAVHVAGTNGKGTTCAVIERVLREAGHRTGLFTSPHLVDFRERIRVDGRWADEAWIERRIERYRGLPAGRDRTFFEVATALAFEWFAERRVEWAVVEVGLGGRLDSTNVLEPEVCAIVSIGLDHTEMLGSTLEAIAAEKAGIVKRGVPVVIGPLDPAARRVVEESAAATGAPVVPAAHPSYAGGAGAGGPVVALNLGVALGVIAELVGRGLAIPHDAVRRGIELARWPGRLEACPTLPRLLWDGAHNPDGARALVELYPSTGAPPPDALVLALSGDKDLESMLAALEPLFGGDQHRVVATQSRDPRGRDPAEIARAAESRGWQVATVPGVEAACRIALERGVLDRPVLLTGSLFAVGEAMEAFGGAPGEQL